MGAKNKKSQNEPDQFDKTIISGYENKSESYPEESPYPLAGFLVSFSRSDKGEFWSLFEGNKNLIGSNDECDIVLKEATVSSEHAMINIRRSKNDNRLMFVVTDKGSANGVFVNDHDIEYKSHECNNHDKLKIGNYEMFLIVIDKQKYELKKNANFKSTSKWDEISGRESRDDDDDEKTRIFT